MKSFYGNCLLVAMLQALKHPGAVTIRFKRNRRGRWHCYWSMDGIDYEFYARGRSSLGYFRNLLYKGEIVALTQKSKNPRGFKRISSQTTLV